MANSNDGKGIKGQGSKKIETYGDDGVALFGNEDAKKLAKEFKELSKDGLTKEEIQKLQKLDDALKGAEFHCMSNDVTLVVQKDQNKETDFIVLGNGLKQNTGFVQQKPGRAK